MPLPVVRDFTCGACGAPRTTTDDAVFIACAFCGAMFDASTQRWCDPASMAEMFARGHAMAFWASPATERFHALAAMLERIARDGPVYRALAQEYHYVYAILHPDRVPAAANAKARAEWAARAAVATAAIRFDPELAEVFARARNTVRAFGNARATADELVDAARIAVAETARAYALLQSRPELAGDYRLPALHYARIDVRLSLATMLMIFDDPAIYDRVATEVFGDRYHAGDECRRCGAPLVDAAREIEACGHCGAVIERFTDDPWIRAKLSMFAAGLLDLHRTNALDTYVAALGVFSCIGSYDRAGVARVAALVARAIPWLPAAELRKAAGLYRDVVPTESGRSIFDAALASLEPWTPDSTRRPVPPPRPSTVFDEPAWLAKSRRLFGYARGGHPVHNAFGIAIADILASMPDARPPITAELVLRFFDVVLADIPRTQWLAELSRFVAGYADTAAGPLVRDLVDILEASA